jgi:hypothetical protein
MSDPGYINFDKKQVKYLVEKTGRHDPHEAVDYFVQLIKQEGLGNDRVLVYLAKLMEKDGV